MSFVSFAFLFLFLVVLGFRLSVGRRKTETTYLAILILASVVFYSWHVPVYIGLLLGSTLLDFWVARWIVQAPMGSLKRRWLLIVSLSGNLGVLGFFKYWDFLCESLARSFGLDGTAAEPFSMGLALPLGISFYTFQSLSYSIDVYRGRIRPVDRFWQLFLFVGFFPQLVAGPIVRARDFLYQISRRRRVHFRVLGEGTYLIVRGFFLKMVCADNLAPFVENIFAGAGSQTSSTVLILGAFFFGCQIFCDFAGYSSIARGVAYVLGFRLPVNFDNPYLAASFSEFWRRWHITLSQWLRDFLYFPLGGNRISTYRTYFNLMVVMLLGGLWHGAAWTYVTWGAIHGGALAIERLLGMHRASEAGSSPILRIAWFGGVQAVVFLAWIVFRASSLDAALVYLSNILTGDFGTVPPRAWLALSFCTPVMIMHLRGFLADRRWLAPVQPLEKAFLSAAMFVATLTLYGRSSDFIYFQF